MLILVRTSFQHDDDANELAETPYYNQVKSIQSANIYETDMMNAPIENGRPTPTENFKLIIVQYIQLST
jgi:hypothetical protein